MHVEGSRRASIMLLIGAALVALTAACGDRGEPTSTSATSATPATSDCAPVGTVADLPVSDDFEGACRLLVPGSDGDSAGKVVDGMFEVTVAESPWFAWLDLERPAGRVDVAVTVEIPPKVPAPVGVTLMCLGPRQSLDKFRFTLLLDASSVETFLFQDPEQRDWIELARGSIPLGSAQGRVRMQLACSTDASSAVITGRIDDASISARVSDASGYVPFQAIGLRVDPGKDVTAGTTVRLDDLDVHS